MAGVLAPRSTLLFPTVGAVVMSLSTVVVAINPIFAALAIFGMRRF
jgi:hypothetical protein